MRAAVTVNGVTAADNHENSGNVPVAPESYDVDWPFAAALAQRVVPAGAVAAREVMQTLVAQLRQGAERATQLVAEISALEVGNSAVRIVDRATWSRSAVAMMQSLTENSLQVPSRTGARMGAVAIGATVAMLAPRVLGQFDPYSPPAGYVPDGADTIGQLLLVAPNVLHVERQLGADQADFRLWVCLHEQAHAAQFTAAPWLADLLRKKTRALVEGAVNNDAPVQLREVAQFVISIVQGRRPESAAELISQGLRMVGFPEDLREQFAQVTAIMSVLEGHADVVMDAIGTQAIPSVVQIRSAFDARRAGGSRVDRTLRRAFGYEAKIAQYRIGADFVRAVEQRVGLAGFNAVFSGPSAMPSVAELDAPEKWVERIHG